MNRMKYLAFLPLTTLLACASVTPPTAVTNTPATVVVPDDTFNVPNGHFSTMYSGALAPFASVTCDFAIEQAFFGSKWRPIVSIIFSEQARFAEDAKYVKVSAVRSSEDVPWLHEITAYYGEERETKVPIPVDSGEVVEPLSMIMTDDGYVWIVVGDDVDGASYLDASAMKLAYWRASVSGVKGSGDCDTKILDRNNPNEVRYRDGFDDDIEDDALSEDSEK